MLSGYNIKSVELVIKKPLSLYISQVSSLFSPLRVLDCLLSIKIKSKKSKFITPISRQTYYFLA